MSQYGFFLSLFCLGSLSFLDVLIHVFHQIWESHYLFNVFGAFLPSPPPLPLSPPSFLESPCMYVGLPDSIWKIPLALHPFLYSVLLFIPRVYHFNCPTFKFLQMSSFSQKSHNHLKKRKRWLPHRNKINSSKIILLEA